MYAALSGRTFSLVADSMVLTATAPFFGEMHPTRQGGVKHFEDPG